MQEILPGIHRLALGGVNAYLIDHGELTLIDTGSAGQEKKILGYLENLGRKPGDIRQILITHLHPDHTGGLAALKAATGAAVYLHALEAEWIAEGKAFRGSVELAPGLLNKLLYRLLIRSAPPTVEPVRTAHLLEGGEYLPVGAGIRVLATPGHTAGHLSFLYEDQGGVLFAGDVALSVMGLALMPFYEDLAKGRESLRELGKLSFRVAGFGHGKPILKAASERIRKKYG